jgi:hypothetical protein
MGESVHATTQLLIPACCHVVFKDYYWLLPLQIHHKFWLYHIFACVWFYEFLLGKGCLVIIYFF